MPYVKGLLVLTRCCFTSSEDVPFFSFFFFSPLKNLARIRERRKIAFEASVDSFLDNISGFTDVYFYTAVSVVSSASPFLVVLRTV